MRRPAATNTHASAARCSASTRRCYRPTDIETDLKTRRKRAEEQGWLGELEGIDLTLSFLHSKRAEALRLHRTAPVELGLPRRPDDA
jgi:hypothetical protein